MVKLRKPFRSTNGGAWGGKSRSRRFSLEKDNNLSTRSRGRDSLPVSTSDSALCACEDEGCNSTFSKVMDVRFMHIEKRVGETLRTSSRQSVVSFDERRGFDICRRLSSAIDTTSQSNNSKGRVGMPIRVNDRKGEIISVTEGRALDCISASKMDETVRIRCSIYGEIVGYFWRGESRRVSK
jgi:hypothetical protein